MDITAIIGQTACGKSDFAHRKAIESDAVLLSMDSLSVYRTIDIASAKPSAADRENLTYFGVDIVDPDMRFGVDEFIAEFKRARDFCTAGGRDMIIVGGSSFYLKALLDGLSALPDISETVKTEVFTILQDVRKGYGFLKSIDGKWAEKIKPNDRYRIEKALLVALASGKTPTVWFNENPPIPLSDCVRIIYMEIDKKKLWERITARTKSMIKRGLIDEIKALKNRYGKEIQPTSAIGIKETLEFLEGKYAIDKLEEMINIHTRQLAKRQKTFNVSQFDSRLTLAKIDVAT
jgi:tRNA dimethylallyltransferase